MKLDVQLPPWLARAEAELGVKEVAGPEDNPRVIEYHSATSLMATDDEVPWCSSFVNWCFAEERMERTKSARARSWLGWGVPVDRPPLGCVVVLERGGGNQPGPAVQHAKGHVGFFVGFTPGRVNVMLLGGNQTDSVSVVAYPASRVLGFRWPA